jgi:hypothetical protein
MPEVPSLRSGQGGQWIPTVVRFLAGFSAPLVGLTVLLAGLIWLGFCFINLTSQSESISLFDAGAPGLLLFAFVGFVVCVCLALVALVPWWYRFRLVSAINWLIRQLR